MEKRLLNEKIENLENEIETLAVAYNNANQEISNLKMQNEKHIRKIDLDKRTFTLIKKALENAGDYINQLHDDIKKLEKSNKKMRGKNQSQGARLQQSINELRTKGGDEWKKYTKKGPNNAQH